MSLKLFHNGCFLDAFPHLFVSTTSLTWFDFQLLKWERLIHCFSDQ